MDHKRPNGGYSSFWAGLVACGALGACQGDFPEVQERSRFIEIGSDIEDLQVCAGTLPRMDAYVERVLAELGELQPRGVLARYHVVSELEDYCSFSSGGCAWPAGSVPQQPVPYLFSNRLPLYHEIGHAIHLQTINNNPPSLFAEGFAMRYENEDGGLAIFGRHDHTIPIDEMLAQFPVKSYVAALTFTNAVIDVHGMDKYKEVFAAVRRDDSPQEMQAKFQEIVGESMEQTEQAYRGVDVCGSQITQCMGVPVPWQGEEWVAPATASCGDSRVVGGATSDGGEVQLRVALEVPKAGTYRIEAPNDSLGVELVPCDLPCHQGYSIGLAGGDAEVHDLPQGRYEVVSHFDLADRRGGEIRIAPDSLP